VGGRRRRRRRRKYLRPGRCCGGDTPRRPTNGRDPSMPQSPSSGPRNQIHRRCRTTIRTRNACRPPKTSGQSTVQDLPPPRSSTPTNRIPAFVHIESAMAPRASRDFPSPAKAKAHCCGGRFSSAKGRPMVVLECSVQPDFLHRHCS
jgi:hypothetical protein